MRPKANGRSVAIIGFGSQGRAHAERLKAGGYTVRIGLPPKSRTRRFAQSLGYEVGTPAEVAVTASTVALLVPDQHGSRVAAELAPKLRAGSLLVFAAGFPLTFPNDALPERCDIVLVAPHGPGSDLLAGRPVSGFVGVHRDTTGRALQRARTYAKAIGLRPVYPSRPEDEALGDVFGEQTLLCGGLLALTAAVAEVMLERGLAPQNVYFETVAQLDRLSALLKEGGVDRFWNEISDCAAAGAARSGPRIADGHLKRKLRGIWDEIAAGRFARRFYRDGRPAEMPAEWRVLARLERARKQRGGLA